MIIRSRSPFRVSFGGGGTDMAPYCTDHGGCVISTTIDRHVYITLEPRKDNKIQVSSIDFNKTKTFTIGDKNYDDGFELFKGTINVLGIEEGFDIISYSELPTGSGMGGSSSLLVALIGAFNKYYKIGLDKHQIAEKAYEIERVELRQKGGYQDQFAASYGGFNFIEFTDKVDVNPMNAPEEFINELSYRLVLCYVGGSHLSSLIQDEVLKGYKLEEKVFMEIMQHLKDNAYKMKLIVESNNTEKLTEFGNILHDNWALKKRLSSKISNEQIEKFYLTSRKFGVLGGKLLGAGGGGHLLLFSDPSKKFRVIKELKKINGKIVPFHFDTKGLEVWKVN